jgi:hypothetical protein
MKDSIGKETIAEFAPLLCDTIVYRALIKQKWINKDLKEILADAFVLRKDRSEVGISVNIASVCSPQDCASRFKRCEAVASLHVGRVRAVGLDIIQNKPNHAHIVGLPYIEDDEAEWEKLSDLLAKQSRLILLPKEW